MKIVHPRVDNCQYNKSESAIIKSIEYKGKVCYKSEDNITDDSAIKFVNKILENKHFSVLEHEVVSLKVTTERAVSHCLVRHRNTAYSQESTMYCNYSKARFGNEIAFILPAIIVKKYGKEFMHSEEYNLWYRAMLNAECAYFDILKVSNDPKMARQVLPLSTKTEIYMTANIRQWFNFLDVRLTPHDHPNCVYIAELIYRSLNETYPTIFNSKTVLDKINYKLKYGVI